MLNLIQTKGAEMEHIIEIVSVLPVDFFMNLGFLNVVIPAGLAVLYVWNLQK